MDFLKVLSRGTNVGKGAAKNAPAAKTPSSGATANPQLFGRDATNDDRAPTPATRLKTKKRKRGQNHVAEATVDLPPELDFFGHGKREDKITGPEAATEADAEKDKSEAKENQAEAESAGGMEPMTEEESRRILRSHKVKITLLEDYKAQEAEQKAAERKSKKRKKAKEQEVSQQKKGKVQLFPQPLTSFGQLRSRFNVNRRLAENIDAQGYTMPTEVQLASLPLLLDAADPEGNGLDLLTVAPTGSGKTLAFLIPVVESLLQRRKQARNGKDTPTKENEGVQAIVLAPTKELASQIVNEGRKLSLKTGIKVSLMRKGMEVLEGSAEDDSKPEDDDDGSEGSDSESQGDSASDDEKSTKATKKRKRGQLVKSDILVSTPLSLLHALQVAGKKTGTLPSVKYFVLDEADVLLDPLFRDQTLAIWNACTSPLLRVSLWSATMGSSIEDLAKATITSRWTSLAAPSSTTRPNLARLVVGLKDSAIPNIHHQLTYAATEQGKLLAIRQLLHPTAPSSSSSTPTLRPPFLIFTQTIPRAQALHAELQYDIPPEAGGSARIAVLHSSLSASRRDGVMARFRRGDVWVLITTDLLARGVDFRGVNGVVNYDVPSSGAAYVHRVGRTGRAGRQGGVAVTLYTEEDVPFVRNVANVIKASEALRRGGTAAAAEGEGAEKQTVQQWLLDALPTPSKRDKQLLKKRGVEARRTGVEKEGGRGKWRTQISTKPGFARKMEHNRKAAVEASRKRKESGGGGGGGGGEEESEGEEFGGFDD
ncbi:atp-dependent rna helicase rok1 [Diplodia corticola]|uniref:ATP-dependent RNA helicase ROK1 n=1 Tax=Diplodia corticola TaxID=236234 RepID=A0A1J9R597_9PEZI|nr:atp-dependent rna helicase rok1 [Diplodia corticola]OJD35402.1 atp-dependent rna helicase rok1 [Diplodia corticola]